MQRDSFQGQTGFDVETAWTGTISLALVLVVLVVFRSSTSMDHLGVSTGSVDPHARVTVGVDAVCLGMTRDKRERWSKFVEGDVRKCPSVAKGGHRRT
jgi:hypothetical protein